MPISWGDLLAWMTVTRERPERWELDLIFAMDHAWAEVQGEEADRKKKQPKK